MTWSDVAAVVGAAAWLPQIWSLFQRPKVTPIVGGQIEIGFSTLGPIFNPKMAFRVERKSALVTGIDYVVTHERGQSTQFRCVQLVEYGIQSESTSGERAVHQRNQDVVAVALVPAAIAERKTGSQEVGCLGNLERLNIALGRAIERHRGQGADWIDQLMRSTEYAEIKRYLLTAFVWQPGKYTVECRVTVAGQSVCATCRFGFEIGEPAFARLQANLGIIEGNFRTGIAAPAPAPGTKQAPDAPLNWIYPYAVRA